MDLFTQISIFLGNPPLEDSFEEMMSQLGDLEAEKGLDDSLDEMISQIDEMEVQRQLKVENWLQQNATVGREKKDSKRKPKRSKPDDSDKENSGGDQQNNPQPKKSKKKESNQNSSNQNLVPSANNQRNNSLVQNSATEQTSALWPCQTVQSTAMCGLEESGWSTPVPHHQLCQISSYGLFEASVVITWTA